MCTVVVQRALQRTLCHLFQDWPHTNLFDFTELTLVPIENDTQDIQSVVAGVLGYNRFNVVSICYELSTRSSRHKVAEGQNGINKESQGRLTNNRF